MGATPDSRVIDGGRLFELVTAPESATSEAPAARFSTAWRWVRVVVVGAISLYVLFLAWLLAALTIAGARFGWTWTAAVFAALGYAAARATVPRGWAVARRRAVIAAVVVGLVGGVVTAHIAPPTPGRLRHEARDLAQPGWRLVGSSTDGNPLCFDYCTSVTLTYEVDGGFEQVVSEITDALGEDFEVSRYEAYNDGAPAVEWSEFPDGDVRRRVSMVDRPGPVRVSVQADAT